jgi:hypothetical protein
MVGTSRPANGGELGPSANGPHLWLVLHRNFHHQHPGTDSLRRRARRHVDGHVLQPGRRLGHEPAARLDPRVRSDRHQHRNRGRHLSTREAAERNRRAGVRHCSHHGVSIHRDRPHRHDHGGGRERRVARCHWRRGDRARSTRQHLGVDVRLGLPVRTRTRRRLRERLDAGLPDVPLRPRAASHGDPGPRRRPAADHLVRADPVRGLRQRVRTAIYCAWKGFRPSPIAEPEMAVA